MKIFFEAQEKGESEDLKFIQQEVSSKEEAVLLSKNYDRSRFLLRVHFCHHDEEVSKPCTAEEL